MEPAYTHLPCSIDTRCLLATFQAAQLSGLKSRFVYMLEENHWVTHAQTALVWQGEFYKWLRETL